MLGTQFTREYNQTLPPSYGEPLRAARTGLALHKARVLRGVAHHIAELTMSEDFDIILECLEKFKDYPRADRAPYPRFRVRVSQFRVLYAKRTRLLAYFSLIIKGSRVLTVTRGGAMEQRRRRRTLAR